MLRLTKRLFSDKDIGKLALTSVRCYTIDKPDWDKYNNQITNTYSPYFKHIDSILSDTVISQTNKIRDLNTANYRNVEEIRDLKINVNQNYLHIREHLYQLKKDNKFVTFYLIKKLEEHSKRLTELCEKIDELNKK